MRTVTNALKMVMTLMLSLFLMTATTSAQTTLLQQGFETGVLPVGWTTNNLVGSTAWLYNAVGGYLSVPATTHSGLYNARLYYGGYGAKTELITPVISFTGYTGGQLQFWHAQGNWGGDQDSLTVLYRENGAAPWKKLAIYTNNLTAWTMETISLPNLSATYQLNFRGCAYYGYGVVLDDILVTGSAGPPPPPPPATITVGTGTSTTSYPYLTFWHDGRTQLLFTAAEIMAAGGSPGSISSVGFNVSSYATQMMNGFNIRLMNTTATTVTSWQTGMTTVYTGTYAVPGTGWQMITLQTPFVWDGSNLLMEVCYDNTAYTSYSYVYGSAQTSKAIYYYTDGAAGCSFTSVYTGTVRPNLRFVEQPWVGTLTGTVKNCYNNANLSGVLVTCGTQTTTTSAAGTYTLYNVPTGNYNVTYSLAGFITKTVATTITNNNTTTNNLCLDPIPATYNGVVTNAWSGNTIVGAKISVNTTPNPTVTYSTANGAYSLNVYPGGTYNITVSKAGYDNLVVSNVVFVTNTTTTLNLNMLQNTNAPGAPFTATLNSGATAVNLSWLVPNGNYEILGDDGTQENWTVWAEAGNQNAVKFSPVGYPFNVTAGKVNVGTLANYPGITPPLAPFKIAVMKADGPGGLPGTGIDTIDVTPLANQYGWIDFSFPGGITITSGDFYLVMIQGGIPPNSAGIAVDMTNPQLRSYERFVTGGAPWIPAAGNFMLRAIGFGPGGPLPPQDNLTITGEPSAGAIYQYPMSPFTGKQGICQYRSFDWSTLDVRNSVPAIYTQKSTVPPTPQPESENAEGSTFNGQTIGLNVNTDAVLYDNGPLVNSPGTGAGGLDESILQTPNTLLGSNQNQAAPYYIADDFTVAGGQWAVTSMDFYGYQTSSGNTSTFTGIYVQIWNGQPGIAGSTVVWGDMTTNRLASTSFANIYRVAAPNGGVARPIMKITANTAGLTLNPGNYWVVWTATGSLASGPWCPPVTINNTPTTGNAIQYAVTVWQPIYGATTVNPQGMPFAINGTVSGGGGGGSLTYQVWRLKQGEETNEPAWTSLGTTNNTYMTDNSWPTLACNAWRWAAKVIYPGNRLSAATFSNVLGKCWTANVNVCVTLTCAANLPAGTIVKLTNVAYPDTNYTLTTDTTGCVHFTNVWKGDYTLTATRFTYPVYSQNVTIMGDVNLNITMLQEKAAPTGLFVDDHSLVSTWNPPRSVRELFVETWASGSFATNQWVESPSTSNWAISTGVGNPAPSAIFNYSPTLANYSQTLTSKNIVGVHAPIQQLKYDIFLNNYGTTTLNQMAVEVSSGTTWTPVKNYDNSNGSISWTSETVDISAWTHNTFKIRFRAYGEDSFDINNWNVDNIRIIGTDGTSGPNPCVIGYNFYLNNILSAFTVDTTYTIPASQVVYGQTYTACVKAVYGSGYSDPNCYTFVSHFLCPVADLTADAVENAAYLTWSKPSCTAGEAKCYVYDDGTMENGWAYNPGYNVWLGNKFIAPATDAGTITKFKMLWWNNTAATNQNFQIDIYSLAGVLLGSSQIFQVPIPAPTIQMELVLTTPIPFTGPFYGMLHWNNFTGSTHWFGYDQNGPYVSNQLAYAYDGTTFTPWTTYAGAAPGVFCLQACGLVSGDGPEITFNPEIAPVGTVAAAAGILSHSPEGEAAPQIEPVNNDNAMAGTGLIGYNVYNHNGAFYQYVPGPDSLSTYVFNLDPGTYCFDVKAKYDLTVYGFPGTFGEAIAQVGGPACVVLEYGIQLPFFEPWDQGTFAYNSWIFQPSQGNWSVNTGLGNPAPSADFSWQPIASNYQFALVSPVIDASPWTCANIWLDFDYKLVDRNATGNEKLNVDIYYNGSWKSKLELTNAGSVNWTPQHIDITGAKGKAFRVRFLANGASSDDILHWYVDNIHAYGICKAPTALSYTQSQFTTTLTWTPPACGGGQVVMQFIFDDGTAENGWGINPTYVAWIGNEFPISATLQGVLQSFDLYFMANGSAGTAQPTIDVYDGTQTLVGSSAPFTPPTDDWLTVNVNDIPFAGMFYAMVKWNNFSSATNYLGTDEDGPYSSDDLCWYTDGAAWDKLSAVAGSNPSVALLRATALVGGDMKSVQLVAGAQPTQHMNVPAGTFARSNRSVDTYNHATMGLQKSASDSSTLLGYNVYRTADTGIPPYSKLNSSPVTATTYVDTYPNTTEPGKTFKYYVTVLFNDSKTGLPLCEAASDTVTVTFPAVGVNELTNGQVMIYPNPASENVNVKSDYTINGIEVMNFVGQTVYTNSNVDAKTAKINVTSLRSGVYFVKVSTDQGVRTVKITVTH